MNAPLDQGCESMGIPFGRYELLKRIAAGGMGEVFLARQAGLEGFEKLLVVKVLLPHLAEDSEFIEMFLDEARIAARLTHPNVAQIFDLGQVEGAYYLAMEYIRGEDVVRLWKAAGARRNPVPLALAARIAADAAAGLDYAHKAVDSNHQPLGIVHRDVSPQNILVSFDGGVKLIDFGVAKAADRRTHTATGTLKGKYSYMSPEQANGDPIDHRSDIFALGVVLYEMATSERLFKRDTEMSTLRAVADCELPRPSERNPDIDPHLESVILKALARKPEDRFQDAQAFRLAIEDWMVQTRQSGSAAHLAAYMQRLFADRLAEERAVGKPFGDFEGTPSAIFRRSALSSVGKRETPPAAAPPQPEPEPSPHRGRTGLYLAGGAVALLALVAVAFVSWPRSEPVPVAVPAAASAAAARAPTLSVRTEPGGASVSLDGREAGVTPLAGLTLKPGHASVVRVSLPGYEPEERTVQGTGEQSLELTLRPLAPAEVTVSLNSVPPGATVLLGEEPIGATPLAWRTPKSEAPVTLVFRLSGHRSIERTVIPRGDDEVSVVLTRAAKRPARPDPLDIKLGR